MVSSLSWILMLETKIELKFAECKILRDTKMKIILNWDQKDGFYILYKVATKKGFKNKTIKVT